MAVRTTSAKVKTCLYRYNPAFDTVNESQQVRLSGGSGSDTYKLTFNGQTTAAAIAETATAAQVQTALETLSNIGSGDVVVTGIAGSDYEVVFQGQYAAQDVPLLISSAETNDLVVTICNLTSIDQYIEFANTDITYAISVSSTFAARGSDYHTQMETLLAAHYTSWLADPKTKEEEFGKSLVKFRGTTGSGFQATPFGQQLLLRDNSGILAEIASGTIGGIRIQVLGPG